MVGSSWATLHPLLGKERRTRVLNPLSPLRQSRIPAREWSRLQWAVFMEWTQSTVAPPHMPRGPVSQVILVSVKLTNDPSHHRGDTADFLSGVGVPSAQPSP